MRGFLVCLGSAICVTAVVLANPNRDDKNIRPPLGGRDALNYASQLAEITQFIADQYVHEISRTELSTIALKGLYEAADVPVPSGLGPDVQKAAARSEYDLRKFFARTRQGLGNPEPLRGTGAILASLQAIVGKLDPYSAIITGPDVRQINGREPKPEFGLELLDASGAAPLVVRSVTSGSPAQKAGLRPGDQITSIDGEPAKTGSAARLAKRDSVELVWQRPGARCVQRASLKSEVFHPEMFQGVIRTADNSWEYFVDRERKIAHIRIAALEGGIAEDLSRALGQLREAKMRGLLLDLRWCPGGFLDDSRQVADLFLGEYNLVHFMQPTPANLLTAAEPLLDNHSRNATVQFRNQPDDHAQHDLGSFTNFPIVVLINGETTGGAELIAAVLQDNRRARIAGQRTRGKASVQRKYPLQRVPLTVPVPNMELKLTNGMLIRPSGKNLNRFPDSKPTDDWGVRPDPDLEFWVSAAMSRQLQQWWQGQSLRPGWDNSILPLDDPSSDPQRQAALRVLADMLK